MSIFQGNEQGQARFSLWLRTIWQRNSIAAPTVLSTVGVLLALGLLLGPPLPWNIRLPFYLILLVWTMLRPRVSLYLMAFAVPWGSLDFISIGSLRLNSADILVGFLALGWLLSWGLPDYMAGGRDRERSRLPFYLTAAVLLLIGAMVLSMLDAQSKQDSLKEIFKWLEFATVALLGSQYLRTSKQIWTLIICVVVAAITQALFGYAQTIFGIGPVSFVRSSSLRVYGTFGQPNPYAGYLDMALVVALSITLLGRGRFVRPLAAIATGLIGGAFLLSQSRGGQIALIAALLFIILVGMPQIRVWMRVVLVALFAFIEGLVVGFIPLAIFSQISRFLGLTQISLQAPNPQDYSTAERLAHWIAGIHMYLDHPLLGVGIGNYPDAYPNYYVAIFVNSLGQAHNYYINIAAETGTIGLLAYLCFVCAMLVAGASALRQVGRRNRQSALLLSVKRERVQAPLGTRHKLMLLLNPTRFLIYYRPQESFQVASRLINERALAIGLLAALLTVCVHNLVDDLYDHSMTTLIALLLIALVRLGNLSVSLPRDGKKETAYS